MNQLPLFSVKKRHARHQNSDWGLPWTWTWKHPPIAGIRAELHFSTGSHLRPKHRQEVIADVVWTTNPIKSEPKGSHGNLNPSERYWQFTARLEEQRTDSPLGWLTLRKMLFLFLKQLWESKPSSTTNNVLFRVFNVPTRTCKPW